MDLIKDSKPTVVARAERDPKFAVALLNEAANHFLGGEPAIARTILRDLVDATVGFEFLAQRMLSPTHSVRRMLCAHGDPSMEKLATIFVSLQERLKVSFDVGIVEMS